jgi:hypothetical protein
MSAVGHVHDWGRKVYVDYCHYTLIVRRCKGCATVREDPAERDFALNPEQVVFAREDCARCRERVARDGVTPACWGAVV